MHCETKVRNSNSLKLKRFNASLTTVRLKLEIAIVSNVVCCYCPIGDVRLKLEIAIVSNTIDNYTTIEKVRLKLEIAIVSNQT